MSAFPVSTGPKVDRVRVADRIFRDLRDQILRGELVRGVRLPSEKDLAERYGVSGPTVREAIRGLTITGLVDVRHGSGAYVSADGDALVAMSLGAAMQLKDVAAADVLGILAMLNEQAAAAASKSATENDLRILRARARDLQTVSSVAQAAAGVRAFHGALANASHNPLLALLCGFLADLQTELAMELSEGSLVAWRRMLSGLTETRSSLVEAIARRDRDGAIKATRAFHAKTVKLINALPMAKQVRVADPQLRELMSSMMARIGAPG